MRGAEDFDLRWPDDGDRLFVESTWAYDAHVVCDPAERFCRLPMGYKRAGDLLVKQAATGVVDRPNVILRRSSATDGLRALQKLVSEMHEADQWSDGFRFAARPVGAPFMFGDRGIDMENLREVMQGIANFFEWLIWTFRTRTT